MLSFSYDYDILSWGLLHYLQVRMMRVWLLDQPTGCLSNLSLPCQDRVIARALLMDVTKDFFLKEKSQKRATVQKPFVVCNIVLDEHDNEWCKIFEGNLLYRCCSDSTKRVGNETSVECGLHVKVSDWLHFFYIVINCATLPMLFFWPSIILVLPDFLFTFEDKEDAKKTREKTGKDTLQTPKSKNSETNAKPRRVRVRLEESYCLFSMSETEGSCHTIEKPCNEGNDSKRESDNVTVRETSTPSTSDQNDVIRSQIPVDDVSPITIKHLMRCCTGKSSVFCSDYSKLLFLYYILLFIIYYYKLVFSLLYKDNDLKRGINLPGARFEGQLTEWFNIATVYFDLCPKIIILVGLVLIVLPLILMFYIKPCDLQDLCSECGKNPFYLRTDIREHLRSIPRHMVSMAKPIFTSGLVMTAFKAMDKSRCSALASVPSVRYLRILAGKFHKCFSLKKYRNCKFICCLKFWGLVGKWILFFTCGLACSIILSAWFIAFWCVGLALLIINNLFCFVLMQGIILFWYSPLWRLFLFAWHVIRQLNKADPSERLLEKRPCLSCTYKCSIERCKRYFEKYKQYLKYETNKCPAAGDNGNTHAEQGNDSTDHSNAGNENTHAKQGIDSTDHSNTGNENTHAKQGIDSTDHSNTGNENTHAKQGIDSTDHSNAGNENTHAKQGIDSTDHSNTGNENTHAKQGIDSTDHSNAGNENTHAKQGIDSTDHCNAQNVCVDLWSFVLALFWTSCVTIIACSSCRFVARMVGFVTVGLFWNSKVTIPYITFLYVLLNHTSCCYSSIQSRYKEIKVMISKQPRSKGSGEKIGEDSKDQSKGQENGKGKGKGKGRGKVKGEDEGEGHVQGQGQGQVENNATICYGDNIPLDLFWFVCNDCQVLPLVDELCLMFLSVLAFAFFLVLAVAAIMFLDEENSAFPGVVTTLVQAGAILISGKLPEWVFKRLIKDECFIDDEKIEKQNMVKQAVKAWHEMNAAGEVMNPAVKVQSVPGSEVSIV